MVEENCEISVEHASDIDSMQIGLRAHWIRREISVCLNHHMERYVRPQDLVDQDLAFYTAVGLEPAGVGDVGGKGLAVGAGDAAGDRIRNHELDQAIAAHI